jgi:4-oxalocrotonate tautomerase family enzyme
MPAAHINVLKGHQRSQLRRLIVEVSDVLARILQAPKDRLEVWITEIDPELWGVCGVPAAEVLQTTPMAEAEMPFIQMVLLEGRPREQHHALIADVTEVVARVLGARRERIRVHIAESRTDCWGIGGVPASIARAQEISARAAQSGS